MNWQPSKVGKQRSHLCGIGRGLDRLPFLTSKPNNINYEQKPKRFEFCVKHKIKRFEVYVKQKTYNNKAKALGSNLSQTLQNVKCFHNNLGTPIWSRRHPLTIAKISLATRLLAGSWRAAVREVKNSARLKFYPKVFSVQLSMRLKIFSVLFVWFWTHFIFYLQTKKYVWFLST